MKYCPLILPLVLAGGLLLYPAQAQAAPTLRAVPTFENCGIYLEDAEALKLKPDALRIRYREMGAAEWQPGHPLTDSPDKPAPRGSLFGLREGTEYEVRCENAAGEVLAETSVRTWSNDVPIRKTIQLKDVNPGGGPFLIDQGGTAEGWVRYVGSPGYVLDGLELDEETLLIEETAFVIVENVTIRGGKRHGIQIRNSHDVRIINCDIAGFGRAGEQDLSRKGLYYMPGEEKAINWDAGVYLDLAERTVIERCFIHDPRGHANSWFYSHPQGPNAIFVRARGEIVLRYNDLVGTEKHRWNDVIEGHGNGKPDGGFNRDSDIYGNYLSHPNDDGIELDGGQQNVRFYGNKVEGGLCGISTAPNLVGPSYIYNNLVVNLGDERGVASAATKNGGGDTSSLGMSYFYHNVFHSYGRGITGIGFGKDKNRTMFRGVSRNNILALSGNGIADDHAPEFCGYDYDLFTTPSGGEGSYAIGRGGVETYGLKGGARFAGAEGADFSLRPESPARGAGAVIPGFQTWQASAAKVDMGLALGADGARMVPLRRFGLSADRYQVNLAAVRGEGAPQAVSITITAGALPEVQPFQVLTSAASEWLTVSPRDGTLAANSSVTLRVGIDPAKATGNGLLLGALTLRLASGDSVPVSVYGIVSAARLQTAMEAEELSGSQDFEIAVDETASGNKFVKLVDPAAGKSGKGSKKLSLEVDVAAAGKYYLYLRIICPPPLPAHDSLFFSLNGGEPASSAVSARETWTWVSLAGKSSALELKAGKNQLALIPREEILVDRVLLLDRPLFPGESVPGQ